MARNATICMDGKTSVDQGDYFPHQSLGSKTTHCDLDTAVNWYSLKVGHVALPPIPKDSNGVPYRLCSSGHYSPVAAFSRNASRHDHLDPYCKQCRAERQHAWRIQEAEVAGRILREKAGRPKRIR